MHRRVYLAALGATASASLAGCSSAVSGVADDPCSGEDCHIGMNRTQFLPDVYEISVGDTVVWKNTSEAYHTVTAYEGLIPADATFFATGGFDNQEAARNAWQLEQGGRLGPRETFEHTFDVPGTYEYFCIPHERAEMDGKIIVSE